jgi:hypothetical protein
LYAYKNQSHRSHILVFGYNQRTILKLAQHP